MVAAAKNCAVEGCSRPVRSLGWCKAHHLRYLRHGDPLGGGPFRTPTGETPDECTIDGCNRPHNSRGLCQLHAARLRRNGTTDAPLPAYRLTEKVCGACGQEQPIDAFRLRRKDKPWRASQCKDCERSKAREWAQLNEERIREKRTEQWRRYATEEVRRQRREAEQRRRAADPRVREQADRINRELQAKTRARATSHGARWTGFELEIAARKDLTAREVAEMLGRSYYAVMTARERIRKDPRYAGAAGVPLPQDTYPKENRNV